MKITIDVDEPSTKVWFWQPYYHIDEGKFAGTKVGATLDGSPIFLIHRHGVSLGIIRIPIEDIATAVLEKL